MIPDSLRPFLSRIIAGLVGTLAAYLETKFQIIVNPDTKAALVSGALGVFSIIYPITHRLLDKKINPGDAASSHLAVAEKVQVAEMKSTNYPE